MKHTTVSVSSTSRHPREVIGIDLGDRWSRYCVLDQAGKVTEKDRIRTTPQALAAIFGKLPPTRIVIEVGAHSPWVSRLLQALGHDVVVANPRKVRLIYESDHKNDRLDARMLARLGRVDVSLLAPMQPSQLRSTSRPGAGAQPGCVSCSAYARINAARGMVKSMGGRLPRSTTAAFASKVKLLGGTPRTTRSSRRLHSGTAQGYAPAPPGPDHRR